jgi:hypothetical protein
MRLRSIALLLLLALGLRLGVGPHPCHAMAMKMAMAAGAAKPGSCHGGGQRSPKVPLPGEDDCCKGGHILCERGCQTAAVLQIALPAPAVLPFQQQVSCLDDLSTPLFVFPIDHIPLA